VRISDRKAVTVIDVWLVDHPFPNYLEPIKRVAAQFGASHPGYEIRIQAFDNEVLPTEVARAAERGRPPHIAEYYYTATQLARDTLAADGTPLFTSVQKAIGGRTEILGEPVVIDDLIPAVRGYYTFAGDLTSMPVTATTILLYANATLLRRAGISALPRTWQELEAACRELPEGTGVTWPVHGWLFQQAVAGQGGLLADHDNGRSARATTVNVAAKELLAYVEWWRRLHTAGLYRYTGKPLDWYGTVEAFATQQTAFVLSSSKMTEAIAQMGQQAGFDVEVGQLPHNADAPYAGHMVSGQSLWLTAGLDENTRDGALAFTQFLVNARNGADWHKAQSFLPITQAAYDLLEGEGWFARHPRHRVATEQVTAADGSPAALGAMLGDFAGIQGAMTAAMEDVLVRGADPATRFDQAAVVAQRLLEAYNAQCVAAVPRTPDRLDVV
jgi:sn-glycerol 3-phosphate transport system substrate-binding protein